MMPEKIDQTDFAPRGNCQSAVLAMLLGLELAEVPNFFDMAGASGEPDEDPAGWWQAYYQFLQSRGWWFIAFHGEQAETMAKHGTGYYEVCGTSSRGVHHVVVYCNGKAWHDPHPSREGLLDVFEVKVYYPIHDAVIHNGIYRLDDKGDA